jgi:hypothetical protein
VNGILVKLHPRNKMLWNKKIKHLRISKLVEWDFVSTILFAYVCFQIHTNSQDKFDEKTIALKPHASNNLNLALAIKCALELCVYS